MKFICAFFIIFLCIGSFVNGQYYGFDKFTNKYLRYRMLFSCMGHENMKNWTLTMMEYTKECYEESGKPINFPDSMEDASESDKVIDISKPMYSKDLINFIKTQAVTKIDIYSCVLKKFKMIDDDDRLQYNEVTRVFRNIKLDPALKEDMLIGFSYCKDIADFTLKSSLPTALSNNLKSSMAFMRCKEEQMMISCIKNDFRHTKKEYELEGLDGFMSNMTDEQKIMEIVWANLQLNTMIEEEEIFI